MSELNEDIKLLLEMSDNCLKASKTVLEMGLYSISISDSYYAMFNAVRACLFNKKISYKTHSAISSAFSNYFIKEKLLVSRSARLFAKALKDRVINTYDHRHKATKESDKEILTQAIELTDEIKDYLKTNSFYV